MDLHYIKVADTVKMDLHYIKVADTSVKEATFFSEKALGNDIFYD